MPSRRHHRIAKPVLFAAQHPVVRVGDRPAKSSMHFTVPMSEYTSSAKTLFDLKGAEEETHNSIRCNIIRLFTQLAEDPGLGFKRRKRGSPSQRGRGGGGDDDDDDDGDDEGVMVTADTDSGIGADDGDPANPLLFTVEVIVKDTTLYDNYMALYERSNILAVRFSLYNYVSNYSFAMAIGNICFSNGAAKAKRARGKPPGWIDTTDPYAICDPTAFYKDNCLVLFGETGVYNCGSATGIPLLPEEIFGYDKCVRADQVFFSESNAEQLGVVNDTWRGAREKAVPRTVFILDQNAVRFVYTNAVPWYINPLEAAKALLEDRTEGSITEAMMRGQHNSNTTAFRANASFPSSPSKRHNQFRNSLRELVRDWRALNDDVLDGDFRHPRFPTYARLAEQALLLALDPSEPIGEGATAMVEFIESDYPKHCTRPLADVIAYKDISMYANFRLRLMRFLSIYLELETYHHLTVYAFLGHLSTYTMLSCLLLHLKLIGVPGCSKSFCLKCVVQLIVPGMLKTADLDSAQAGFEQNDDNMTVFYDEMPAHLVRRMDEIDPQQQKRAQATQTGMTEGIVITNRLVRDESTQEYITRQSVAYQRRSIIGATNHREVRNAISDRLWTVHVSASDERQAEITERGLQNKNRAITTHATELHTHYYRKLSALVFCVNKLIGMKVCVRVIMCPPKETRSVSLFLLMCSHSYRRYQSRTYPSSSPWLLQPNACCAATLGCARASGRSCEPRSSRKSSLFCMRASWWRTSLGDTAATSGSMIPSRGNWSGPWHPFFSARKRSPPR